MNNKKIIVALSIFLLTSNNMYASTRSCLIGVFIAAYVHENILTSQDLTMLPELSTNDFKEYNAKLITTVSNSYTSLKKITTDLQSFFTNNCTKKTEPSEDSLITPDVPIEDNMSEKPVLVHNDPEVDQIEERQD